MKLKFKIAIIAIVALTLYGASVGYVKDETTPNKPWGEYEKLTFAIKWGIITCGIATLEVRDKILLGGRETYHIVSQVRSAAFIDPFFKVRNKVQSFIDAENLVTVRFERKIREGRYRRDATIIYDHENLVAYENGYKFEITENIQDILSALYYLRTKPLEVGKRFTFDVGTGKKLWPLEVNVIKREKISTPLGKFNTLLVIPKVREEGLFRAKGDLKIWLTDDEMKIPVLMRSRIILGTISAVLIEKRLAK